MIEDKCICVCLIPAFFFCLCSLGILPDCFDVLVASSSPVEGRGRDIDDRCVRDYRSGHKSRKYSIGTVTFAEKPRAVECIVNNSL